MIRTRTRLLLVGLFGVFAILATSSAATPTPEADGKPVNDRQFHDKLLEIARTYASYGRVDDEVRWAPELCRGPRAGVPRFSRSSDDATHGKKLYSLFARDRAEYLKHVTGRRFAVGVRTGEAKPGQQVVVKEAWLPEEVKEEPKADHERISSDAAVSDHFRPYLTKDGKTYKAARKADLYIMMQLDPKTPGTDNGWVYGTVTPDGKTVTSAGKVASCIKCHETRPDRLFGINDEIKKGK